MTVYFISYDTLVRRGSYVFGYLDMSMEQFKLTTNAELLYEFKTTMFRKETIRKSNYQYGEPIYVATVVRFQDEFTIWNVLRVLRPDFTTPIKEFVQKDLYKLEMVGQKYVEVGSIVTITDRVHGHGWEIGEQVLVIKVIIDESTDDFNDTLIAGGKRYVTTNEYLDIEDYLAEKEAAEADDEDDFDPVTYWIDESEFRLY